MDFAPTDGPPAAAKLDEIAANVALSDEAESMLAGCEEVDAFVDALTEKGMLGDAVRTLAMTLPVRRAGWWAVLAAWEGVGTEPADPDDAALSAAVRWVRAPSEPSRRETADKLAALDRKSPCHFCVRAIRDAGASAGPEEPLQPIHPVAAAKATASTVFTALTATRKKGRKTSLRQLLEVGLEIRDGKLPWTIEPIGENDQ